MSRFQRLLPARQSRRRSGEPGRGRKIRNPSPCVRPAVDRPGPYVCAATFRRQARCEARNDVGTVRNCKRATPAFAVNARSLSGRRCRYVFGRFKLFGRAQVAIGKPAQPARVGRGSFRVRGATMLPGGLTVRRRPREFKLPSAGNFRSRYRRPTLPDGSRDVSFLESAPLPVRIRRSWERPGIRSLPEARGSAPDRVLGLLDIKGAPGEPDSFRDDAAPGKPRYRTQPFRGTPIDRNRKSVSR